MITHDSWQWPAWEGEWPGFGWPTAVVRGNLFLDQIPGLSLLTLQRTSKSFKAQLPASFAGSRCHRPADSCHLPIFSCQVEHRPAKGHSLNMSPKGGLQNHHAKGEYSLSKGMRKHSVGLKPSATNFEFGCQLQSTMAASGCCCCWELESNKASKVKLATEVFRSIQHRNRFVAQALVSALFQGGEKFGRREKSLVSEKVGTISYSHTAALCPHTELVPPNNKIICTVVQVLFSRLPQNMLSALACTSSSRAKKLG